MMTKFAVMEVGLIKILFYIVLLLWCPYFHRNSRGWLEHGTWDRNPKSSEHGLLNSCSGKRKTDGFRFGFSFQNNMD